MKKYVFLIPLMAVLAVASFIIFGMSMNKSNSGTTDYFFPFSASAEVTELNKDKDRTHTFILFSDGERSLLDGYFFIDNKKYAGKIFFDGNNSYLFRPNPNQAVVYSNKKQPIYGFIPVNNVINNDYDPGINVTVLKKDERGFPIKYEIEYGEGEEKQKSIVSFSNIVRSKDAIKGIDFALPEDTKYIAIEEYIQV